MAGDTSRQGLIKGTAAAKVFQLPELLEMILVELADQTLKEATPYPVRRADMHLEPASSLGRVRGVNRTYRDLVDRSRHLQDSIVNADGAHPSSWLGLAWLLQKQLQLGPEWPMTDASMSVWNSTISYAFLGGFKEAKEKGAKSEGNMRLLRQTTTESRAKWRNFQLHMTPRKDESHYLIKLDVQLQPNNRFTDYYHRCKIEGGTTLGDIFDEYEKTISRTPEEHMEACEKFWE